MLIVLRFGVFRFTAAEAEAIRPLIENSPLLSWLYAITSEQGASRMIGSAEVVIALLIAARPISARLCAVGSLAAAGMFLTTLSFMITTPGMWIQVEGLIVPSAAGAFVIKDILLLGAASWSAGEAFSAAQPPGLSRSRPSRQGVTGPGPQAADSPGFPRLRTTRVRSVIATRAFPMLGMCAMIHPRTGR